MTDPMLFWVTRSSPFNLRTSRALAEVGHRSITAPVLDIRPTGIASPATEPTVIAFTSAHAVLLRPLQEKWRSLPVFAVGEHSAALAREEGYADVRSADGDVSDLRDLILGSVSPFGHVVHFGAHEPAGDLVGELRAFGRSAEHVAVYESIEASAEQLKPVAAGLPFVDGIIVHSPRGARVAAGLARQARWHGLVFALSNACAEPFRRLPGIAIETAAEPTEKSLMHLIGADRVRSFGPPLGAQALPGSAASREGAGAPLRLVVSNGAHRPEAAADRSPPEPDQPPPPFAA